MFTQGEDIIPSLVLPDFKYKQHWMMTLTGTTIEIIQVGRTTKKIWIWGIKLSTEDFRAFGEVAGSKADAQGDPYFKGYMKGLVTDTTLPRAPSWELQAVGECACWCFVYT